MVATLGGQPQIVTFTLDELLARGEAVHQVVVVYLAGHPRYQAAYHRLMGEFAGDRYAGRSCHLRGLSPRAGDTLLAEAAAPEEVEAVRRTFFELLDRLKAQGERLHLSLSGGRRILALTALAAAMQYLTPADCVWHIYTPPELTEQARGGAIMHAPPDSGVHLVTVPFVPWAAYFPGLRPLLGHSPHALRRDLWLSEDDRRRCRQVWQALSPRQRDVLRLLVQGMSRKEAAAALSISVTTLDTHRNAILRLCLAQWKDRADVQPNIEFVRRRFGAFLAALDEV